MNAREKLYLVIIALLLGSAALFLGAVATAYLPLDVLGTGLEEVYGNFRYALLSAFALIGVVLLLFVSLRRNECVETLLQQGPLGEVRICFKAVENLVLKAAKEIKGVRETKTRIVASDNGLIIFLRAVTYPDQNIPQVTAELQAAVKDYVENTTGSTVSEIKVMIENVVTDTVKAVR
jgi:uncharacterized alkaline shock family protein YloU